MAEGLLGGKIDLSDIKHDSTTDTKTSSSSSSSKSLQNLDVSVTHETITNTDTTNINETNVKNHLRTDIYGNHVLGNNYDMETNANTGMQFFGVPQDEQLMMLADAPCLNVVGTTNEGTMAVGTVSQCTNIKGTVNNKVLTIGHLLI